MYNVAIIKHPTKEDWQWAKTCTLNTVHKTSDKEPTQEWKIKLLKSEHSPIRELWFGIKMEVPYWVSVHFVRHHIGVNHYISTQRDDRTNSNVSRADMPQGTIVSHIMSVNAQELIFMAHRRLCTQASLETRQVMQEIVKKVLETNPEFESVLVPMCAYRGSLCTEFNCCGLNKKYILKGNNENVAN